MCFPHTRRACTTQIHTSLCKGSPHHTAFPLHPASNRRHASVPKQPAATKPICFESFPFFLAASFEVCQQRHPVQFLIIFPSTISGQLMFQAFFPFHKRMSTVYKLLVQVHFFTSEAIVCTLPLKSSAFPASSEALSAALSTTAFPASATFSLASSSMSSA